MTLERIFTAKLSKKVLALHPSYLLLENAQCHHCPESHCTVVGEIGHCVVAVDFSGKKTFIKIRGIEHFCSAARRDFYYFVLL